MPPLKKGDVRAALDKRIERARKSRAKLLRESPEVDIDQKLAEVKGQESALQNVRHELFGERLPKVPKA